MRNRSVSADFSAATQTPLLIPHHSQVSGSLPPAGFPFSQSGRGCPGAISSSHAYVPTHSPQHFSFLSLPPKGAPDPAHPDSPAWRLFPPSCPEHAPSLSSSTSGVFLRLDASTSAVSSLPPALPSSPFRRTRCSLPLLLSPSHKNSSKHCGDSWAAASLYADEIACIPPSALKTSSNRGHHSDFSLSSPSTCSSFPVENSELFGPPAAQNASLAPAATPFCETHTTHNPTHPFFPYEPQSCPSPPFLHLESLPGKMCQEETSPTSTGNGTCIRGSIESSLLQCETSDALKDSEGALEKETLTRESFAPQSLHMHSVGMSPYSDASVKSERPPVTKDTNAPRERHCCRCFVTSSASSHLTTTEGYNETMGQRNELWRVGTSLHERSLSAEHDVSGAGSTADSRSTIAEVTWFSKWGNSCQKENVERPFESWLPSANLESSAKGTDAIQAYTYKEATDFEKTSLPATLSYGCGSTLLVSTSGPAQMDGGRQVAKENEQDSGVEHDHRISAEAENAPNERFCSSGEKQLCESEAVPGNEFPNGWRRTTSLDSTSETCDFWSDTGYREDTVTTSPGARDTTETIVEEVYDDQTGQSDYSEADSIRGSRAAKNALESTRKDEHQNEDRRLLQGSSAECVSPKAYQEHIRRENAAKTLQRRWRQRCLSAALDFEALVCCIRHIRTLAAVEIQRIYRGSRLRKILKEELYCLVLTLREEDVVQADGEDDASRDRGRSDREGLRSIELIGAFGDHPWEERIRMRFCSVRRCYTAARPYAVGRHLFKFIVDNTYRCSSQYAQVADPDGNVNNCVDVSEPVPPALCLAPRFPWPLARSFRCGGPPSVVDLCGTLSKHVFSPQVEQEEESRKTGDENDSGDSMLDRWRQEERKSVEKSCSEETRSNRNVACGKPTTVPVSKDQTGVHDSPRLLCHGNGEAKLGDGKCEVDGVDTSTRENFVESLEVQTSSQNVDKKTRDQPAGALLGAESLGSSITLSETTRQLSLSLPLRGHTGRCQKVNVQQGQDENEVRIVCSLETPLSRVPTHSVLPEAAERINSRDGEEPAGHPAGVSEEGSVQRLLCGHTDEEDPEMLADVDDVVAPLLRFPRWSALDRRARHERSSRILPAIWRTALTRKSSVDPSPPGRGCNAATNVSVASFPGAKEKCEDCGNGHSPNDGSQSSRPPTLPARAWNTTRVWSPSPRQVAARIHFGGDGVGESFREGDHGCETLSRRTQAPDKASHSNPSCFHGFEAEDKPEKDASFDTLHEVEKRSTFSSSGSVQSASDTRDSLICTSEQPLDQRMKHRQGDSKRRAQSFPAYHHRQNTVACLVETVTMLQPQKRGSLITPDSDTFTPLDSGVGVPVYLNERSMDATEALALTDVACVSQSSEESRESQNTTNVLVFDGALSALVVPGLEGGGVASKSRGSRVADLTESKREANPDAVHTLEAKGSVSLDRNPSLSYAIVNSEGHGHSSEAENESSCVFLVGPRPPEGEGEQIIESDPFSGASDAVKVGRRSGASAEGIDGSEMQCKTTRKQTQDTSACSSSDGLSLGTAALRKQTSFSDLPVSRLREEIQRQKETARSDILTQGKGRLSDVSLPANISSQCGEVDGMNRLTREPFHNRKKAASADWSLEFAGTHMEERCDQFVEHGSKFVGGKKAETQEKESVRGKDQSGNAPLVVEEAKLRRRCSRLPPLDFEKLLFTAALKIPEKCIHSAISQSMPIAWLRGIQEETTSKVLCRVAALRRPTPSDSPHPCGMQELGGGG